MLLRQWGRSFLLSERTIIYPYFLNFRLSLTRWSEPPPPWSYLSLLYCASLGEIWHLMAILWWFRGYFTPTAWPGHASSSFRSFISTLISKNIWFDFLSAVSNSFFNITTNPLAFIRTTLGSTLPLFVIPGLFASGHICLLSLVCGLCSWCNCIQYSVKA